MWFDFFKRKKNTSPKTFEGKFVTEEEIDSMISLGEDSFVKKEFKEINEMFNEIKKSIKENG